MRSLPFAIAYLSLFSTCRMIVSASPYNIHETDIGSFLSYNNHALNVEGSRSRALENITACTICDVLGLELIEGASYQDPTTNATTFCKDVEAYASFFAPDDRDCFALSFLVGDCCDASSLPPKYQVEAAIRSEILDDYDIAVPPMVGFDPVIVDTFIDYYAVTSLDLTSSTVEVFVWVTLTWNDPRLAWSRSQNKYASQVSLFASMDVEKSDIWVPELNLFNRYNGLEMFGDAMATVDYTGRVEWIRDGGLRALCSFIGLKRMPFDTLGCRLNFGTKSRYNVNFNLLASDTGPPGLSFPPYSQTYNEYQIVKEKTSSSLQMDSEAFVIDLYFKRAKRHYIMFVVLPNIIFTLMSFGQFSLDNSSDRLGFGVNVMLIIVAQGFVTAGLLPICEENLWINMMNFASTVYSFFALIVSLLVGNLYARARNKEKDAEKGKTSSAGNDKSRDSADMEIQKTNENDNGTDLDDLDKKIESIFENAKSRKIMSYQKVMLLDKVFMVIFYVSYLVFLIFSFSTNHKLEDDVDKVWN